MQMVMAGLVRGGWEWLRGLLKDGEADGLCNRGMHGEDEDGMKKEGPGKASVSEVCLHMEESSLRKRRRLTRNTASLKQTESMYVLTSGALSLSERAGLHYSGTNKGTVLGPIVMGDLENDWSMTVKDTEPLCIRTATYVILIND